MQHKYERSVFPQFSLCKYTFQIHTNQVGGAWEFKDYNCASSLCVFLTEFCLRLGFIIQVLKNNHLWARS